MECEFSGSGVVTCRSLVGVWKCELGNSVGFIVRSDIEYCAAAATTAAAAWEVAKVKRRI